MVRISEVERPTVKGNELLVKVHATTVNRTDCGVKLVRGLGAGRVIDYAAEDASRREEIVMPSKESSMPELQVLTSGSNA